MAKRESFLSELKRRNVLRAAVLYAGAIWALAQGISQLGPAFGAPDWVTRWFVIAGVIGFPFWLAFAWFYEFTPQGIKRESEVAPNASITHSTARKLDFAIIGVMAVAIVLLGSGYFIRRHAPATFNPSTDTLVVLPFRNLSGDSKQQYFSDGITEELTDALGQNPALRVIAWDTASKYRNTSESARDIGKALNVAHILHGSIARDGDQVRITTELVDTRTGYQLWSQHYDDSFANIFKVQDQVSQAIASALQVKLAQADLPAGGTRNPQAHELVLKGRALMEKYDAASLDAARQDFEQALVLDPDYADAHAWLSSVLLALTAQSNLPLKTTLPTARAHAQKALALDPRNADAWAALGSADASTDPPDIAKAKAEFQKALALDPSNAGAHLAYGNVLPLKLGLAQAQEATMLDPADAVAWNNLAVDAQDLGDWVQMITAAEALLRLNPTDVDSAFQLAYAYQQLHQSDKMLAAFDLVKPATAVDKQQVAAGKLVYRAVQDPALRPQGLAALEDLSRHQSSPDVASNLLQLYLALGQSAPALQLLESLCPAAPIGCSDLAINPIYRALRTDPRFQRLAKKYTTATLGATSSAASAATAP
ncbi:MAG: tetratricopeptide repeat protein [Rhodanobacteraceae bacterium]